ncbi:hypothetical protein BH11PSE11_BH11PSE11_28220 [soil metagenome]
MLILLMISIGVVAALLLRLVALVRQIPSRNEDFDVFSVQADDSMFAPTSQEASGISRASHVGKLQARFLQAKPTAPTWALDAQVKD